jgi:hypothetical protein
LAFVYRGTPDYADCFCHKSAQRRRKDFDFSLQPLAFSLRLPAGDITRHFDGMADTADIKMGFWNFSTWFGNGCALPCAEGATEISPALVRQHLRRETVPQNKILRPWEREKVAAGRMRVVGKNILNPRLRGLTPIIFRRTLAADRNKNQRPNYLINNFA